MSYADTVFIQNVNSILTEGTNTLGQNVRPHWPDGKPAYTFKRFGVVNRYDLQKEFPAITLRRTGLKSCMDEILWIFQKKSNNIKDLTPHIWDSWADEYGSIGKAYGYQLREVSIFKKWSLKTVPELEKFIPKLTEMCKGLPSATYEIDDEQNLVLKMDQVDAVLYQLRHEPFSRRIMTSLWHVDELSEMNLQPCCWNLEFNVTDDHREDGKLTLNMILNQRSNDILAANNWNVAQYAILLMMFAQVSNMVPGEMVHVIADQHIYDRHVPVLKELINETQYPAPKVSLNPEIKDFYAFTTNDLMVEGYQSGGAIAKFEVAI